MDKPVGMPFPGRTRQFIRMADIETVINQRGGQMTGEFRRHWVIPRLLRLMILRTRRLPVFRRGRRQRQHAVLYRLARINQHRRLVVRQELFVLIVTNNHDDIRIHFSERFSQMRDPGLAACDLVTDDVRPKFGDNRRICFFEQCVVGQLDTIEVEMRFVGKIAFGMLQKIVGRASKHRPM